MVRAVGQVVGPPPCLLFGAHHGALNLGTVLEQCPGAQLEGQDDPQERDASGGEDQGPEVGASESKTPENSRTTAHSETAKPTAARPRNVTVTGYHPHRRRWWCCSA